MANDFETFFDSLTPTQQEAFAARVGTTVGYINAHLKHGRKIPRSATFEALVQALDEFGAGISRGELATFFFDRQAALAARFSATGSA